VRDALDNALPPKRKVPLRRHTTLAPAIPLIDAILLADRDVPHPQRYSASSIYHQIQCELPEVRVAGSTVRGYVRKRKTELGLASQLVDLATERSEVFEWMRAVQQGAIPRGQCLWEEELEEWARPRRTDIGERLEHVQIGRAYAMQGDAAKAKAAYKDFLTLWKDTDPDIPIFIAAKAEYAML
jgi:hypothetical protein